MMTPIETTTVTNDLVVLDAKGRPTLRLHPRVRLSRIVKGIHTGLTIEGLMEHWPYVGREEFEAALKYYDHHRSEIDTQMEWDREEFERIQAKQAERNAPVVDKIRYFREVKSAAAGGA